MVRSCIRFSRFERTLSLHERHSIIDPRVLKLLLPCLAAELLDDLEAPVLRRSHSVRGAIDHINISLCASAIQDYALLDLRLLLEFVLVPPFEQI